jgi:acyl-CoA synthetase (AMP-forming)/AMP-acid ligase II
MPYRGAEIAALLRHSRRLPRHLHAAGEGTVRRHRRKALSKSTRRSMLAKDFPGAGGGGPFLLLYTSGTTASPKGVPHSYHTMLSNARLGVPEHRLSAADRILSAAPFTHLFGLYALHCACRCGGGVVLLPAFNHLIEVAAVSRNKNRPALWTAPAHIAAVRAQGCSTSTTGLH